MVEKASSFRFRAASFESDINTNGIFQSARQVNELNFFGAGILTIIKNVVSSDNTAALVVPLFGMLSKRGLKCISLSLVSFRMGLFDNILQHDLHLATGATVWFTVTATSRRSALLPVRIKMSHVKPLLKCQVNEKRY